MSLIELTNTEFNIPARILNRLRAWSEAYRRRRQLHRQRRVDRLAFRSMLRLDDATLHDIGHTREDIERGNRMPIEVNAALKLQEERVLRIRQNQRPQ